MQNESRHTQIKTANHKAQTKQNLRLCMSDLTVFLCCFSELKYYFEIVNVRFHCLSVLFLLQTMCLKG